VELSEGSAFVSARDWDLRLAGVDRDDIAVRTFVAGLKLRHEEVQIGERKLNWIELAIRPDAIETGLRDGRHEQAYRIEASRERIALVGNARPGLFYAVQTFLQLLAGPGVPLGTITDWPQYEIRAIHWDTKHHQDRMETLKRFLDWMARFKLNAVSFELEDKFEYPSHPVIGCPGAFTTAQLQELADYGLARHVQIVPNVQAPAHMCHVLKHAEFAHLRCDGSNYQICMDEPEARRLIFDMYDDLCQATRGVRYFHVSTDEVYYAGICQKHRLPYNPVNRSLTWVDFVNAAHEHLASKGRQVIVWAEFPLLAELARQYARDHGLA
jgi:N-acetyl-beta-hexosaminidase